MVELTEEQLELLHQIREKKALIKQKHEMLGGKGDRPVLPKKFNKDVDQNVDRFEKELTDLGLDPSKAVQRLRSRSRSQSEKRESRKRTRSVDSMELEEADTMDTDDRATKVKRLKAISRSRSRSKTPAQEGLKDFAVQFFVSSFF